jgi:heterodisulfide reductase subunit C
MIQQVLFILITIATTIAAFRLYSRVWRNIRLGKSEVIAGHASERWRLVLLVAFGQKKMFKQWGVALLHLCIYVAFLITQIELVEILLDGFTGQHRIFAPVLGGFYTFVINSIELLSVLACIATVVFLARRNLLKIPRFIKPEMNGWPRLDANLILFGELVLLTGIFSMNGADVLLQDLQPNLYPDTGFLAVSSFLGPTLFSSFSESTLVGIERFGWWLHILTVFGFILYLPGSKHLHILLAFPNVYFSRLRPRGEMENMPEVMHEVKSMLGLDTGPASEEMLTDIPDFGAKDVTDLSWKTLLESYTCTECGRCTAVCPANLTGKKLSPRKIMMDIRDRAEDVGNNLNHATERTPPSDEKSLFDYISREELHACTTCFACVEACPVMINPVEPILALRRYEILTESTGPSDWVSMFNGIENSGSVWQIPEDRDAWTRT